MHGFQRGDWLALDSDESLHLMSGGTDKNLVANVFYAYSTKIVCDTAHILGKEEDAKIYAERYQAIADAILREYVTASGRLVSETQTACALDHIGYDLRNACFSIRFQCHIAQPFFEKKSRIEILHGSLAEDHGIPGPAQSFIPLRTIGRNIKKVASLPPFDILDQAVDQTV